MRTSVTLDDDVYELASCYAKGRGLTLGAALGELVKKGQNAPAPSIPEGLTRAENGLLVFAKREGRVLTSEMVKKYLEDDLD